MAIIRTIEVHDPLAMLARNRQEDHELMDQIVQREGQEGFARAWFEAQGLASLVDTHRRLQRAS